MKKIEGLKEKLTPIEDDAPTEIVNQMPTLRRMLVGQVGSTQARDGEEAVTLWQIGLKVRSAEDAVELENGEFKTLFDVCDQLRGIKWTAHFHAQVMNALNEAKEKST